MNTKIKNYLGIVVIVVLFIFALSAMSYVNSYSKSIQPSSFRSFSANGDGKITAIPDIAQFTFSVITEGGKDPEGKQASYGAGIAKLQKENTDKVNKIINFIKSSEVADKDIKTQNYNLDPRYQYYSCPVSREMTEPCPPAEIVGYTITQTIAVKIRNFEKIGDIMAGVVQNGANSVSQLSFSVDDMSVVQDKAREEAIKKAKERAKLIAKAGDFKVGKLLSIDEGGYPEPIYRYGIGGFVTKSAMESSLPAPQIEPGSQEIKVNVILRYEIE